MGTAGKGEETPLVQVVCSTPRTWRYVGISTGRRKSHSPGWRGVESFPGSTGVDSTDVVGSVSTTRIWGKIPWGTLLVGVER